MAQASAASPPAITISRPGHPTAARSPSSASGARGCTVASAVYVVRALGGRSRRLLAPGYSCGYAGRPSWSPRSNRLVLELGRALGESDGRPRDHSTDALAAERVGINVIRADGSARRRIAPPGQSPVCRTTPAGTPPQPIATMPLQYASGLSWLPPHTRPISPHKRSRDAATEEVLEPLTGCGSGHQQPGVTVGGTLSHHRGRRSAQHAAGDVGVREAPKRRLELGTSVVLRDVFLDRCRDAAKRCQRCLRGRGLKPRGYSRLAIPWRYA